MHSSSPPALCTYKVTERGHVFTTSRTEPWVAAVVIVQLPSSVWLSATPRTTALQSSLSLIISRSLPKFMVIELAMLSNHLIFCRPLLLLLSIFPSIRNFSKESTVYIRWPKYWHFSFSISPSSEYSGLTSLEIDWFDLPAVQGTLRSPLQHHSSKASILWLSAFFVIQDWERHTTTLFIVTLFI